VVGVVIDVIEEDIMARKDSPSSSPTNAHDSTPDSSPTSALSPGMAASTAQMRSEAPLSAVGQVMAGGAATSEAPLVIVRPGANASVPAGNGSEYFSCGSMVRCVTCHDVTIEGHVMAFDPQTRVLAIKLPSTSKRSSLIDMIMVNLHFVRDVVPLADSDETSGIEHKVSLGLNTNQLNNRLMNNLDKKKRLVKAFKKGISPEGQRIFHAISKTLEDIDWSGDNIKVMEHVTVTPPYKPENVRGVSDSKAVMHVRKIIEKHLEDSKRAAESTHAAGSTPMSHAASTPSTCRPDTTQSSGGVPSPTSSSPLLESSSRSSNNTSFNKKGGGGGGGSVVSKQQEKQRCSAAGTAVGNSGESGGVAQHLTSGGGVAHPVIGGSGAVRDRHGSGFATKSTSFGVKFESSGNLTNFS